MNLNDFAPLGRRYLPLFRKALELRPSRLEALLTQHAHQPEHYHCLATRFLDGMPPTLAEEVAAGARNIRSCTYFSNPLAPAEGEAKGLKPSLRARLGGHQIFTIEYDQHNIDFVCEQAGWLLSEKGQK